jgi:hypothetical protein
MEQTSELMQRTASTFLAALTPEQRARALCPFDDDERFVWHFTPVPRRGIPLKDLTPAQRLLAQALIASGYSPDGAAKAMTIMSLEEVLLAQERERAERAIRGIAASRNMAVGELLLREGHEAVWGHVRHPDLYFLTIFGEPAPDRTWGWRLEGHHVSLNVTLPAGRLGATTPCFFGANPAEVRRGPRAGLRALAAEESLGRALLDSLDERQRARAVIDPQAPDDILTFNQRRAEPLGDAGLPAADLSPAQLDRLRALVEAYAAAMPREVADHRMDALARTDPADLRFAWAGGALPGERHYYRIQAPAFLIEYDNTQDDANHIHTVWRDFAGDWGLDLLGAHLSAAHAS